VILNSLQAKSRERQWVRHQTIGELDDTKLIEGKGLGGKKCCSAGYCLQLIQLIKKIAGLLLSSYKPVTGPYLKPVEATTCLLKICSKQGFEPNCEMYEI
jgi:hypothetical protein